MNSKKVAPAMISRVKPIMTCKVSGSLLSWRSRRWNLPRGRGHRWISSRCFRWKECVLVVFWQGLISVRCHVFPRSILKLWETCKVEHRRRSCYEGIQNLDEQYQGARRSNIEVRESYVKLEGSKQYASLRHTMWARTSSFEEVI